jgi:serine/threonine protein phosphatase PrpC
MQGRPFIYQINEGWRTHMEDAHIAALDITGESSLFGVFDGHGGESRFGISFCLGT